MEQKWHEFIRQPSTIIYIKLVLKEKLVFINIVTETKMELRKYLLPVHILNFLLKHFSHIPDSFDGSRAEPL